MMDEPRVIEDAEIPPSLQAGRGNNTAAEVLRADRLCVSLIEGANEIISGISFSIREGEIFAIAGESGCGKTTLACALTKLLPPATHVIGGRVLFNGIDMLAAGDDERRNVLRGNIRYLFQEPGQALNPIARIGTQMRYAFDWNGETEERFHGLLDSFGLSDHRSLLRAYPHELSIGMLQRILMAAALAPAPRLLVADEPTSAVDFVLKHAMMEHLQHLCRKQNMSVIFITHDLPLARRWAGRLSVLAHGQLVRQE